MSINIIIILLTFSERGVLDYQQTVWPTCSVNVAISESAKRHNLDPSLLKAILYHESRLKVSAVNKRTADFGIGQINYKTAKRYGFDIQRLVSDCAYSVEAAAIVLSHFKRFKTREPRWWCRYNIGYLDNQMLCNSYATKVERSPASQSF